MSMPKLRFKGFKEKWKHRKIGDILQKITQPVKVELGKMYSQVGIRSHGKGLFHKEPVSGASLGDKRIFWLSENLFVLNIVFAWEQAVARTSLSEKGMVASHRFPMYSPKDNLSNTDYILHFFLTKQGKHFLGLASPGGAGRNKTLGQKNFEELVVVIPEVDEQTKIANFLTAVDEKITQLTQKLDLLAQYKKGVMQQIFSQELRFKDDDGRGFPEWEEVKIAEVAQIVGGGTPDTGIKEYWQGNIQWFTPTELKTKYATSSQRTISESGLKNSSAKVLPVGTLLFSSRATVGDVSIALNECTTNQGFQSLIVSDTNINEFIYYWILNNKKAFIEKANGSTFLEISKKELEKLSMQRPHKNEQTKIANFLTAIDDKITSTQAQLEAVKQYKQGLLQQMFV
jgi:type I restriction enzyme S subunit